MLKLKINKRYFRIEIYSGKKVIAVLSIPTKHKNILKDNINLMSDRFDVKIDDSVDINLYR